MPTEKDLERIIAQEEALTFTQFDEDTAFAIGGSIRKAAKSMGKGVGILIKLWDRPLFFGATAGASASNYLWADRKANTVRLEMKSTYRLVIERGDRPRVFEDSWGVDRHEYALAGGAFPIKVSGIGIVGAAAASGLDERADHEIVVAAICAALGADYRELALPLA